MSNEAFRRNYSRLLAKVGAKRDLVIRKTALELIGSMVLKSPVDTGRFRGNWQVGDRQINIQASGPDPDGQGAIARAEGALQNIKIGGVIYLTNSLPYAYRLEHGWSQQAPSGMVALTVREYGQYLAKVVKGLP